MAKDAKMVNAYGETTKSGRVYAVKRPGIDEGTAYAVAAAQGLVTYLAVVRVVVNNKFYITSVSSVTIDADSELVDFS